MNAARRDARLQGRVRTGRCGQGDIARWLEEDSNVGADILSQAVGSLGRVTLFAAVALDWLQTHTNCAHENGRMQEARLKRVDPRPVSACKPFNGLEICFVTHLAAFLDPIAEINEGQFATACLRDLPKNTESP